VDISQGVMCDVHLWAKARHAATATSCARNLLLRVFDMETLYESSMRGGSNKRDPAADAKKPLDQIKLNAIFGTLNYSV
jgi:hypothetical protein